MDVFKRNSNHDVKNIDLLCSFLAGMNIVGIFVFNIIFSSIITYFLICIIGGSLLSSYLIKKKYIYLSQISIQNDQLIFEKKKLFVTQKYSFDIDKVKMSRTYYSLILRCYQSDDKKKQFKISSREWSDIETIERLIMNAKYGEESTLLRA